LAWASSSAWVSRWASGTSTSVPLFVALLHQDALGGAMCRELDVDAFVDNHVDMFVRAYGVARG